MSELESPYRGDIASLQNELNDVKRLLQDIRAYLPSKPTPQRRSERQDKPPAWAEQIITCFSILEDRIGRIQSQTDDIKAQNRRNDTRQPPVRPADNPRPSTPQDSGTANQDDNAAAQITSTHQRRDAEDRAPANAHGDNAATSIKASRDAPMRDYDEAQPSPSGSTATIAATASASQSAPRQTTATNSRPDHQQGTPSINPTPDSQSDGSIDQSPTTSDEQEREPGGHDPDTLMTDAEQLTCGRQDLAKRAAEEQPLGETVRSCGDTASAQVGTPSPSSGTTPQGSDTTEDTSRVSTPNTHHTSPDSSPMTRLSSDDMGNTLITALGKTNEQEAARTFSVPLVDIDLPRLQSSVNMRALQTTTVRYEHAPEGKGYVRVIASRDKPHFDWSAFNMVIKRPTIEEAREIIENAIQNPPSGDISYLMGHSPTLDRCFEPLVPGPAILDNPDLRDLHSQYHHIGNHLSANRFHWEDMTSNPATGFFSGFRSYNEVYFGPGFKLWYAIAMHHTEKFNDLIRKVSKCNDCNQAIGHQNLLVAPTTLDKEGIEYNIDVVGRGQARDTKPGEIHSIFNYGACAARSINDMSPEDKLVIETLKYCEKCGLRSAYKKYGAQLVAPPGPLASARTPLVSEAPKVPKVPKRPATKQAGLGRNTRARTEKNEKLEEQINAAKKADPLCSIPTVDPYHPSPSQTEVLVRAASIRSKVAVDQLIVLTREHTQLCSNLPEPEDSIDRQIIALNQRVNESALSKFRVRFAQVCLARVVDDEKESLGRRCASHTDLEPRAKRYGVHNIHYHLQQGRQWIKICGPCKGLLPLILLSPWSKTFKVTTKGWEELVQVGNHEKLEAFHELLDDPLTQDLDAAGRIFLGILDGGQKAVGWELALSGAEQAEDLASAVKSYRQLSQTSS
ncbi:JmjC domain-containing protein [Fusarium sp. Ph1]|nr:JmjC domain-containing protein [Fusarium sp. Ph1]